MKPTCQYPNCTEPSTIRYGPYIMRLCLEHFVALLEALQTMKTAPSTTDEEEVKE